MKIALSFLFICNRILDLVHPIPLYIITEPVWIASLRWKYYSTSAENSKQDCKLQSHPFRQLFYLLTKRTLARSALFCTWYAMMLTCRLDFCSNITVLLFHVGVFLMTVHYTWDHRSSIIANRRAGEFVLSTLLLQQGMSVIFELWYSMWTICNIRCGSILVSLAHGETPQYETWKF